MEEKKIRVSASSSYDVAIGAGLLSKCGGMVKNTAGSSAVAVITDSNVEKLYLPAVMESLSMSDIRAVPFVFAAGEMSKRIGTFSDILEFLAENRMTRSDAVVALGGGVVGDMAGFAAGCYMRGIKYIQIPTTLLAAVDSSVGGKTAIDLKSGKNLAGLFIQPEAVICDINTLSTLTDDIFADGAAEAIKTGVLAGEEIFSAFEKNTAKENIGDVIARCVAYKGKIVEQDECEKGLRRVLNLGHTAGHAIELLSGYRVRHGHAVAAGMAIIARATAKLGLGSKDCAQRIERVLTKNGLPVKTDFSASQLADAAMSDKKRSGSEITLVIPREIGNCVLKNVPTDQLCKIFNAGLEA